MTKRHPAFDLLALATLVTGIFGGLLDLVLGNTSGAIAHVVVGFAAFLYLVR